MIFDPFLFDRCAEQIAQSSTAGAGMGVDSGLPDFRAARGVWARLSGLAEGGAGIPSFLNWVRAKPLPRSAG
ncbi:MAG: hypothetical protein LBH10_03090 [Burkholderiaceae bacterium]|nr:hypothetical protein [Burkholderiaceae bacterium]